jgi:GNAT superfamily N-acetyltransferase
MRFREFITEFKNRVNRDGITIEYEFHKAYPTSKNKTLWIKALDAGGREMGSVNFRNIGDEWEGDDLYVDDRFRGQGIATIMYDFAKETLGRIVPSNAQTDDGKSFWQGKEVWENKLDEFAPSSERDDQEPDEEEILHRLAAQWWQGDEDPRAERTLAAMGWEIGQDEGYDNGGAFVVRAGDINGNSFISWPAEELTLNEISDERLQSYLSRADRQVSNRMDRMSQARERLNKGYEIYHADRPAGSSQIVDRFEADTPAAAQQYYEKFIRDYVSDVDFDLRLRRATGIMEIARIPQSELGGWGDKDTLEPMTTPPKDRKPLPGGSGFTYAVNRGDPEFMEIMIFDGDTLAAELDLFATLDPMKTWRVETVITDPDYRGRGMGKALYGIALSILKLTIEAGEQQTKFGQQMWLMLSSIPGVEVLGYAMAPTDRYRPRPSDKIVDRNDTWTRYTFPVEPGKRSMRSTRPGTGIYSSQYVSMIAKWTGR